MYEVFGEDEENDVLIYVDFVRIGVGMKSIHKKKHFVDVVERSTANKKLLIFLISYFVGKLQLFLKCEKRGSDRKKDFA